jgi:hypothetical protein
MNSWSAISRRWKNPDHYAMFSEKCKVHKWLTSEKDMLLPFSGRALLILLSRVLVLRR